MSTAHRIVLLAAGWVGFNVFVGCIFYVAYLIREWKEKKEEQRC